MNNQPVGQAFNVFALLSAVIAIIVVVMVELVNDLTLTEDCLLYLAFFLTLVRVMPYRVR